MLHPALFLVVQEFVNAKSQAERKRILERNRDMLLTDKVEEFLHWFAKSEYINNRTLQECLALLRRGRIETAFAQGAESHRSLRFVPLIQALTECDSRTAVMDLVQQNPELLSDEMDQLLEQGIANARAAGDEEIAEIVEERHATLRQLRGVQGIDGEHLGSSAAQNNPSHRFAPLILALTKCQNPPALMDLVEQHPELLSDEMDQLLQQGTANLRAAGDKRMAQNVQQRHATLRQLRHIMRETGLSAKDAMQVWHLIPQHRMPVGTFGTKPISIDDNLRRLRAEAYRLTRPQDMPRRIQVCQKALTLIDRNTDPQLWAWWQREVAYSLHQNRSGNRAENLERVIYHSQQALTVYTKEAFPFDWAKSQNYLTAAYLNRIYGKRAENLERAIEHIQQALTVYTKEASLSEWAKGQNNLAIAYKNRIRGQRAQNLERAIHHYQESLTVYTREVLPEQWAISQHNLALAYCDRIHGQRADNMEKAIFYSQQALTVYTLEAFPENWAEGQNNLAVAYKDRIRGEKAENVELAIFYSQQALTIYTREVFPENWAASQNNLASAYYRRIRGQRAQNLELAIHHYQQALMVYTREAFPEKWAMSQNNLALAYSDRIRGEKAENLEFAIHHYQQALTIYMPDALPYDCRGTANNLGNLLYDQKRFAEARDAFATAHQAVEFMRGEAKQEEAKRRLAAENVAIYARLVHCCLLTNEEQLAFEYATAGKGRAFVDLLASAQVDLRQVDDAELAKKLERSRVLRGQIDVMTGQLLGESMQGSQLSEEQKKALGRDVVRLRKEENRFWQQIRDEHPDYFATQSAAPLTFAEARALAHELDATLVSYYRHATGWVAFVIRPDVPVEESLKVVELAVKDEQLREWWQKFNRGLATCKLINLRWSQKLSDALITPLLTHLPAANQVSPARLVLAPFSLLHLLPLATLPRTKKPLRESGLAQMRYLSDEYVVTITPSLAMLKRVMARRQREEKREKLCALAYPGKQGNPYYNYLSNAVPEVEAIAAHFPKEKKAVFVENAATPQAAIDHAPHSHIAHYACHGEFNWSDVDNSGLLLAEGRYLNVRQIFNDLRLSNATLVTLSACQTGQMQVGGGDELAGLIQGFVYAGTPAVIASLWAVNDAATRYLFERFYEHYTFGQSAVDALRRAQKEMREHGYGHPYYWAAFQAIGGVYTSLPPKKERLIRPAKAVIQPPI